MKPLSRRRWIMKAGVLVPYAASAISAPGQLLLHRRKAFRAAPSGITYLLSEDFEGTGTPSGWTGTGTYGFDYTTSPAPLLGSESAYVSVTNFASLRYANFGNESDVWSFAAINATDISGGATPLWFYDSTNTVNLAYVAISSTGAIRVQHGTASNLSGAGLITGGSTYFFWFHYVAASVSPGSDGIAEVFYSSDQTFPGLGSYSARVTNGTLTTNAGSIRFARDTSGILIVDKVRVSASAIGSNPT